MGIAKFDDGILDNLKFEGPGAAACWLWFCSVLACRRGLTDGFISRHKVTTLVPGGLTNPYKHAQALVAAGLWDEADGGYTVHDYHDWNPSKIDVEDYRATDKARKQAERRRKTGGPVREVSTLDTDRSPDRTSDGVHEVSDPPRHTRARTHAGAKSKSKSLSESEALDLDLRDESPREGDDPTPPRWVPQRGGAMSRGDTLVGNHSRCYQGPGGFIACQRGICVPGWLGQKWLQQYGDDRTTANSEIAKFISDALATLPASGPLGDIEKDFWQAAWKATHGSQAPVAGKGTNTVNAFRQAGERLAGGPK